MSISSANLMKSPLGSVPVERTKIRGVETEESRNPLAISNTGGIMNYSPMHSQIQLETAGTTLSGRIAFKIIIF